MKWTREWQDSVDANREEYANGQIDRDQFIVNERKLHPWLPPYPFQSITWLALDATRRVVERVDG